MSTVSDDGPALRGGPVARTDVDWTEPDPVATALTRTLLSATDAELASLDPLGRSVDTDSLERLLAPETVGGLPPTVSCVEFRYAGHTVAVSPTELVVWDAP